MVFKHKAFCRCGCHYWCSLYSAFEVLGWLVRTMASGKYPSTRHDDLQWALGDSNHDLADTSLGYKAAVIMVKGDWAEFALTMGMPTWAHHTHPCFACKCTGGGDGTMKQTQGVSVHIESEGLHGFGRRSRNPFCDCLRRRQLHAGVLFPTGAEKQHL